MLRRRQRQAGGGGGGERRWRRGEAELRAKEEADAALDGLGVALMYNDRPYNRRGWCVEEDGVVRVVLAHTAAAEKRAAVGEAQAAAAGRRLLDISELEAAEVTVTSGRSS